MEYKLKRSIVERVHKDEFFLVTADSLEEAKQMVDEHEVDPSSSEAYHYEIVDIEEAKELS